MATYHSAAQYEQDFLPHRLGNWQVNPALTQKKYGTADTRYSILKAPEHRPTQFLVDDKGHFKPGVKKINNSFRTKLGPADSAPTRWPKPSVSMRSAPAATMGYKGSKPSCETGKPAFDGVVMTRIVRPQGAAGAAGAAAFQPTS